MDKFKVRGISKRYGKKRVLDNLSFELEPAKIYGLLGRNGAGKTTLLNIITDRIFANSGQVLLGDATVAGNRAALAQIYLMSDADLVAKHTKFSELATVLDATYGFDFTEARRMLAGFDLDDQAVLAKLSTGLKTAAKLVLALNVRANYVFLDEPTLGLDANHRELFYQELMKTYEARPRTFVISTHLINEVQQLLEGVIILDDSKIIKDQPVADLLANAYEISAPAAKVDEYTAGLTVLTSRQLGKIKTVTVVEPLPDQRVIPDQVKLAHLDLQHTFTALTNKGGN